LLVRARAACRPIGIRTILFPPALGLAIATICLVPIGVGWLVLPLIRHGSITVTAVPPSSGLRRFAALAEAGYCPRDNRDVYRLERAGHAVSAYLHDGQVEAVSPGSYLLCGMAAGNGEQFRCRAIEVRGGPAEQSFEIP
jgi:hypothetical protein